MGASKEPGAQHDPDADDDEAPVHPVELTGFWMTMYPVTNEQYGQFLAATGHELTESFADRRFNDPAQPVVTVSWEDARAFTTWLTGQLGDLAARLPTETRPARRLASRPAPGDLRWWGTRRAG